jgi:hypothetical protein
MMTSLYRPLHTPYKSPVVLVCLRSGLQGEYASSGSPVSFPMMTSLHRPLHTPCKSPVVVLVCLRSDLQGEYASSGSPVSFPMMTSLHRPLHTPYKSPVVVLVCLRSGLQGEHASSGSPVSCLMMTSLHRPLHTPYKSPVGCVSRSYGELDKVTSFDDCPPIIGLTLSSRSRTHQNQSLARERGRRIKVDAADPVAVAHRHLLCRPCGPGVICEAT